MFTFLKPKTADVLSHWYAPVPHFNTSSADFYAAVEKELKERQVPDLKISRVEFSEEGLLSAKREYLRMTRERLVFDICAAPFGSAYFFTCRFGEVPPVVELWHLFVAFAAVCFVGLISFFVCLKIFGALTFFLYPTAWIAFIIFAIYLMRNATTPGMQQFDSG